MKKLIVAISAILISVNCLAIEIDAPKRIEELNKEIQSLVNRYKQIDSLRTETSDLIKQKIGARQELENLLKNNKPIKQLEKDEDEKVADNNS